MQPKSHKIGTKSKIERQAEAHIHDKTEPYIMEAILQEIRKVVIRAAGFREAY